MDFVCGVNVSEESLYIYFYARKDDQFWVEVLSRAGGWLNTLWPINNRSRWLAKSRNALDPLIMDGHGNLEPFIC